MTTTPQQPDSPLKERSHRFELTDTPPLQVTVRRMPSNPADPEEQETGGAPEFFVDLADFSRRGLRVRLPFEAPYLERLEIRLESVEMELDFTTAAIVRHVRKEGEFWIAGCSIEPELPKSVVDYLAATIGQDRRVDSRDTVKGEGVMKRDGEAQGSKVEFINLSQTGFCAQVETPPLRGERVEFLVYDTNRILRQITARIRWVRPVQGEDSHLIGASFAESAGYSKLKLALSVEKVERLEPEERETGVSGLIIAACLLSMLIPPAASIALDYRNRQWMEETDANATAQSLVPVGNEVLTQENSAPSLPSLQSHSDNATSVSKSFQESDSDSSKAKIAPLPFESEAEAERQRSPYWLVDETYRPALPRKSRPIPSAMTTSSRRTSRIQIESH